MAQDTEERREWLLDQRMAKDASQEEKDALRVEVWQGLGKKVMDILSEDEGAYFLVRYQGEALPMPQDPFDDSCSEDTVQVRHRLNVIVVETSARVDEPEEVDGWHEESNDYEDAENEVSARALEFQGNYRVILI